MESGIVVDGKYEWREFQAPAWHDVELALSNLQHERGTVTLRINSPPDEGPQSLQLRCEAGRYLLTVSVILPDEDGVLSYNNPDAEPGMLEIFEDLWDRRMICFDFNLMLKAFNEFFHFGNLRSVPIS